MADHVIEGIARVLAQAADAAVNATGPSGDSPPEGAALFDASSFPSCSDMLPEGVPCVVRQAHGVIYYAHYQNCDFSPLLLPGFNTLPLPLQAVVYAFTLTYLFFGVAIISDIFMSSVETLTSQVRTVTVKSAFGWYKRSVPVWNPTVANLSLLAIGSSAPEIMLSVIETTTKLGKKGHTLGLSTIVGSAAYNLLMIPAVCTLSLPAGESRKVSQYQVYLCTVIFSVWAYIWVYIVVLLWTPGHVSVTEAVLTLLQLPLLLIASYNIDIANRDPDEVPAAIEGDEEAEVEGVPGAQRSKQKGRRASTDSLGGPSAEIAADPLPDAPSITPIEAGLVPNFHQRERVYGMNASPIAREGVQPVVPYGGVVANPMMASHPQAHMHQAAMLQQQQLLHAQWHHYHNNPQQMQQMQRWGNPGYLPMPPRNFPDMAMMNTNMMGMHNGMPAPSHAATAWSAPLPGQGHMHAGHFGVGPAGAGARGRGGRRTRTQSQSIDDIGERLPALQPEVLKDRDRLSQQVARRRKGMGALTGRVEFSIIEDPKPPKEDTSNYDPQKCVAKVGFTHRNIVVSEEVNATLTVYCKRNPLFAGAPVAVRVQTHDGTACGGEMGSKHDFVHVDEILLFHPDETHKCVEVIINRDDEIEEDEKFTVKLSNPNPSGTLRIKNDTATVTILDTSLPGVFSWLHTRVEVKPNRRYLTLTVQRKNGSAGDATLNIKTQTGSAQEQRDFYAQEAVIVWDAGQVSASMTLTLSGKATPGSSFQVILLQSTTAQISRRKRVCTVAFIPKQALSSRFMRWLDDKFLSTSYGQQFVDAILPGVGSSGEEDEPDRDPDQELSFTTYALHYICITWKLLFAIVPPGHYVYGIPCFFVCLGVLAFVTYGIEQAAKLFGCACGLDEQVTAIAYVALGTSLPDTFASRYACIEDADADGSITNVTGSNAVNIFLGLGLPWVIAAVWYTRRGLDYEVDGNGLKAALILFLVVASVAFAMLHMARVRGGELGGSMQWRLTFAGTMVCLWLGYIVAVSLESKNTIDLF